MTISNTSPFLQFAHVEEIQSPDMQAMVRELKPFADAFAETFPYWGSSNYIWPLYPLNAWSRVWEYPFVARTIAGLQNKSMILDVGSATTFFPFYLAEAHNCTVVGVDPDPFHTFHFSACGHEVHKRMNLQRLPMPIQTFGDNMPFSNETFDVVYSVSVIEHIPDPLPTVQEMTRVLKRGGKLILTLDVNYPFSQSATGLTEPALRKFLATLNELYSTSLVAPPYSEEQDILTFHTSPMRGFVPPRLPFYYFVRKPEAAVNAIHSKLQRMFGTTKSHTEAPENLAVLAIVLTKP